MKLEFIYVMVWFQVNDHVVVDDISSLVKPLYSPEHGNMMMESSHLYYDSDVSPTQLSKSLFASSDEQLFSGTSQQFHGSSSQPISPEIGIANLVGSPVESDMDAYISPFISRLGESQAAHELL